MKKTLFYFLAALFRLLLSLRYKVVVKGLDKLGPQNLTKEGGTLFLPNHQSALIDPAIVALSVFPNFMIRPMVVEYMYFTPGVYTMMKYLNALPVPNFESSNNSLKRKRHEKVVLEVIKGLKNRENFLLYPAGRLKLTNIEKIGGASAVQHIVREAKEANIVLVRIKGLWGSSFSRALTGKVPPLFPTLRKGAAILLKNLIFFTPRREVIVELEPAPKDFPYDAPRLELNRWLEKWYNKPDGLSKQSGELPGDTLKLVSYSFWKKELPKVYKAPEEKEEEIELSDINKELYDKVIAKLVDLTEADPSSIHPKMSLSDDLGMDSLDKSEFSLFLQERFDLNPFPITELTTVEKALAIASKKIELEEEKEEEQYDLSTWEYKGPVFQAKLFEGKTIPEVFLRACEGMKKSPIIADMRSGILTYKTLKLMVILLAEKFRHYPGNYIGILLPSSVGAYVAVLAIQLAGKIPLMINWTQGPRHLKAVEEISNVQVVLSSWAFLERLDSVDLDGMDEKLVMLETVRREISFSDKIKAYLRSKRSPKSLLKLFGLEKIKEEDIAVLLFTSGSESLPKGVPLSHRNILSNQQGALEVEHFVSNDVFLALLPPFHSFGFSLTGLIGILSGIRTVYYPNPTDGKALAKAFEHWKVTVTAGAPTFIKGMLKASKKEQLKSMRLCVTGAEKTPQELIDLIDTFGKKECLVEGYGITECSPILTGNVLEEPLRGVGRPLPGVELLVVHPETHEVLLPCKKGLILARGPNIFSGYLNRGLEPPFLTLDGKEWFVTGDIGYLDEENYLFISGRKKRFVKIGGEMVSLQGIESELLKSAKSLHWEIKEEGPSIGIIAKEVSGMKPTLFLVTTFKTDTEEVNAALRSSGFSNLIRISEVIQLEEIPIMGTGKINYRALEEKYFS